MSRQRPNRFDVRPRLFASVTLGFAGRTRVTRVVRFIGEKRDDLAAVREPRDQPLFLRHALHAAPLRIAHRARPHRARDVGVARHAADPHRERPILDAAFGIAVTRRRAGELRQVCFAARIDERGRFERERPGVIEGDRAAYRHGVALGCGEPSMQDHVDAGGGAEPVERELHGLGLDQRDHDAGAVGAQRPTHPTERIECGEHLRADTADRGLRRFGLRPKPAVGQHPAPRRRPTEKRRLLEQRHARTHARGTDCGTDARSAAAAHDHVVLFAAIRRRKIGH